MGEMHRSEDRRRFGRPGGLHPGGEPDAAATGAGVCGACGAALSGALSLCSRCGRPLPDNAEQPRYLVIHRGPGRPRARREAVRLLSDAGGEPSPPEVERQLRDLPALFRAPLPDVMIERLAERLRRCGYRAEVLDEFPQGLGLREYLESLVSRRERLLPYALLGALAAGLCWAGSYWLSACVVGGAAAWAAFDHRRFLKRLTLSAARLAGRVNMVPEDVAERIGALLRDNALAELLGALLGSLLEEYARLLDTLAPLAVEYPDMVRPTSQALAQLTRYAGRVAEKALTIEKAGDFDDPGLEERLAGLRGLGSAEIEERARQLLASREERQGRLEWLREVYGTLLVRLEAITDTLRSVRQRVLEGYVTSEAEAGAKITDELAAALHREQEVVSQTATEMEQLDHRIAELALEWPGRS